jgi:fido (protein-threonine AMPylation protein)
MVSERAPTQSSIAELRNAIVNGCWSRAAELCAHIAPSGDRRGVLIARLERQIRLHAQAAQVLYRCRQGARLYDEVGGPLASLVRCSFATIDGRRSDAQAALCATVSPRTLGPSARTSWSVGDLAPRRDASTTPVDLIGVMRQSSPDCFTIAEAGSPRLQRVVGGECLAPRGTPLQVTGYWRDDGALECASVGVLAEVPDFAAVCATVTDLCTLAAVPVHPQRRLTLQSEIDSQVLNARAARRESEAGIALSAADILEDALVKSELSLETLARVHALALGSTCARAGKLRLRPARIRWCGVITFRAPGVQAARSQTCGFLREVCRELQAPDMARHPAALGAEAVARLTSSHPFGDGNGRVARAVAAWLLLRAGFRQRPEASLGVYLEAYLGEQFSTLRNVRASPWGWHQLFYDAVMATFTR